MDVIRQQAVTPGEDRANTVCVSMQQLQINTAHRQVGPQFKNHSEHFTRQIGLLEQQRAWQWAPMTIC